MSIPMRFLAPIAHHYKFSGRVSAGNWKFIIGQYENILSWLAHFFKEWILNVSIRGTDVWQSLIDCSELAIKRRGLSHRARAIAVRQRCEEKQRKHLRENLDKQYQQRQKPVKITLMEPARLGTETHFVAIKLFNDKMEYFDPALGMDNRWRGGIYTGELVKKWAKEWANEKWPKKKRCL